MNIKYRVITNYMDGTGPIVISDHETETDAIEAVSNYIEGCRNPDQYWGYFKFYSIPRREWSGMQYTGKSMTVPGKRTWMTNEGKGCTLLLEGLHFEIV